MQNKNTSQLLRQRLENFLRDCDGLKLQNEFKTKWLNDIIPEINLLEDCLQGTKKHLEGNVAIHTGLVFDNLKYITKIRLNREPDFIENFAVVLHDSRKPQTKVIKEDGAVCFPNHEELAAQEVPRISLLLELKEEESKKLEYLVANHGLVYNWPNLQIEIRQELKKSPWINSLAILQEADAISCLLPNKMHLPIFYQQIME